MAEYPNSIYTPREKENKAGVVYNPANKTIGYVEDVTKLDDEVVAIQTELGETPKNTSADVAERLKGIRSLAGASDDVIVVKDDKVGVGTDSPTGKVHIVTTGGESGANSPLVIQSSSSYNGFSMIAPVGQNSFMEFLEATTKKGGFEWRSGTASALFSSAGIMYFGAGGTSDGQIRMTILADGKVGIGEKTPTALLDINSDIIRLRNSKTPSSAGDSGNAGDICWDSNYMYICVATNTWKRIALTTW